MLLFKILFHIRAIVQKYLLKLVYRNRLNIGNKTTWRKSLSVVIEKNASVKIGNDCFFNNYCSINAIDKVTIGNGCIFGENVKIYDHNHRFSKFGQLIKKQGYSSKPVVIGDNCWIGSNVVILKGVKIGNNCVIGAGITLNKDIPSDSVVRGNNSFMIEAVRKD